MPMFIQPSFAKGEISPSLYGRVDTAAYGVALRKARNCVVHPTGGISNRPGLIWVGPVKDHTYAPRLIDFQYRTDDTYMLEFGDFYMRVMRNHAHVTETAKNITAITAANPPVVTSVAHGFSNGNEVFIDGVVGMTRVNGRRFLVAGVTADTFQLADQVTGSLIDASAYTAYTSGGTAAKIYEITTPYAIADLPNLKFEQSADVMTLTHKSYAVRELTRSGHSSWTLTQPTFAPTISFPTTVAISSVGTAGAVTKRYQVTAVASSNSEESLPGTVAGVAITGATQANPCSIHSVAHGLVTNEEVYITGIVGMTELNGRRFIVTRTDADNYTLGNNNTGDPENSTSYTAYSSGGTGYRTSAVTTASAATSTNKLTWDNVSGAASYNVYRQEADSGLFGFIGSTVSPTFTDATITPDQDTTPPRAANPFRIAGQYPGAVGYYDQRRVFGGSTNKPDTSNYSRTGNQSNFTTSSPTQSDDAITATLASRKVNEIRHYVSGNDLIVLTSGSEWRINSGSDAAFEAATMKQKPQSYWGSSHHRPLVSGNTILFCEENNAVVRSLGYSLQIDGYTGTDMNQFSGHIFQTYTLSDWCYSHAPDPRVYGVRSDGGGVTMTFNQEQQVIAWTTWDTLGKFERTSSLRHDSNETEDSIYFVVKRHINGQTVRYIERTHSRRFTDVRDCFFVDAGLSYDLPKTITNATAANPVVITAVAHGFSNGDEVDIHDIEWEKTFDEFDNETNPDQLNRRRYTVANKTADTFELHDEDGNPIDGTAFAAYVEGGTVRKAVLTVSGYDHLEGQTISCLADGNVIKDLVVTNGAVTLPRKFSRVHIGLKYVADVETLNIEAPSGTMQGTLKKINKVTARMERSRGLLVGPNFELMTEMAQRENEDMGDPTDMLTGDKEIIMPPTWDTNGRICFRQRDPLPMTMLAVIPDLTLGG